MKRRLPLLPCLFAVLSLLPACSRTPEPPPFAPRASPGEKELALIRSKLGDFDAPLVMTLWSREGKDPRGAETGSLLSAMGKANPRITVRIEDLAAENAPRTLRVPQGPGHGPLIRVESPWGSGFDYLGYPADAELTAFLDAILISAGLGPGLASTTERVIAALPGEARIEVFVTPHCPVCGEAVRLAASLAARTPRIRLTVVNLAEFPELAKAYDVSLVPRIWINNRISIVGLPPESYLVSRIKDALR